MMKKFLPVLAVVAAGCVSAPQGAYVGERLRSPGRAAAILAAYEYETGFANAAFNRMLDKPVSAAASSLADASGLKFMGYARPMPKEGVVNAELGPIDDMSLFYVVSNAIEASSAADRKQGDVAVVTRNNTVLLVPAGPPAGYTEEEAAPPPLPQAPPAPPSWQQPPAQPRQPAAQPGWEQPYYYYPQ